MDLHRLKYFLRIADEGSITKAARVLGVAQPALSRQVRLLEEDLGVRLFRRTHTGVKLTEEGERLRASAAAPLRQLERAVLYAGSSLARLEMGLRLGLLHTAAELFAEPVLAGLHASFPKVGLHVTVASTDDLVDAMLNGEVDVALINPVADDRLFYRQLLIEELVAVGGPSSDLSPDRPIHFSELVQHPLVLPGSPSGIANTLQNMALRFNVTINSYLVTDSVEVSRELVGADMAYAILPLSSCRHKVTAGLLRYAPIEEPALTHEIVLATTPQLALPRKFCVKVGEIIREQVASLITSGAWPAKLLAPGQWEPKRI